MNEMMSPNGLWLYLIKLWTERGGVPAEDMIKRADTLRAKWARHLKSEKVPTKALATVGPPPMTDFNSGPLMSAKVPATKAMTDLSPLMSAMGTLQGVLETADGAFRTWEFSGYVMTGSLTKDGEDPLSSHLPAQDTTGPAYPSPQLQKWLQAVRGRRPLYVLTDGNMSGILAAYQNPVLHMVGEWIVRERNNKRLARWTCW